MGEKIINFTNEDITGAVFSVIHRKSFPCPRATKVFFYEKDAECDLAKGYKALGTTIELVKQEAKKPKAEKPKAEKS